MASYGGSTNSLNSNSTTTSGAPTTGPATTENLEQFEVRKQQKDIWENGIEM